MKRQIFTEMRRGIKFRGMKRDKLKRAQRAVPLGNTQFGVVIYEDL
jgi:hypothetical protein